MLNVTALFCEFSLWFIDPVTYIIGRFLWCLDQLLFNIINTVNPDWNIANFRVKTIYSGKNQSTLPDDERSISRNVAKLIRDPSHDKR